MSLILKRLQTEWPAWTAIAFFAALPFGRLPEVPLSVFALSLPFLLRRAEHRQRARALALFLIPLFLCFWVPMVLSSFDSYDAPRSTIHCLAALRYLAAALSMGILLKADSARWRVLRWTAYLLVFWSVDGFVQLFFGADLFGIGMHPDRLNALFVRQYQFYGPTLAMLSPLLLEYARRRWAPWAWVLAFGLALGAVTIAGMRSGWLVMAVVLAVYFVLTLRNRENRELRTATFAVPALAVVVILAGYVASPLLQQRIEQSLQALEGTHASVDFASTKRLPIFETAWRMYLAHPVNGAGVRSFSIAYLDYAEPGDEHVLEAGGKRGAHHAHNLVLEVASETGSIGLVCLVLGAAFFARAWLRMKPGQRQEAFPYALAVCLIFFPINSHFAIFGTYVSSLVWIMLGLAAATFPDER